MTPVRGLDADTILTPFASRIAAAGFTCVGRYLKNLSGPEIAALHGAGLGVWLIFETTGTRALGGDDAGVSDGAQAAAQALRLGAPPGTAIFATVDMDPAAAVLPTIVAYYAGFVSSLKDYRGGLYACGAVLIAAQPSVSWLAGAMGWNGSRAYDAAGAWAIKQGPTIDGGGTWSGMDWPDLRFPYDPDLIARDDIGAWLPDTALGSHTAPVTAPNPPVTIPDDPSWVQVQSRINAARALSPWPDVPLVIDGYAGKNTRRAIWALTQRVGVP